MRKKKWFYFSGLQIVKIGEKMMTKQNLKRYKITFTTYQEFPPSPILTWGDIEDFWHGVWEVSNFGQAYCVDVGDVDYDTATVTHSIWKFLDSDPRKIDRNEVSKLIEDEIIWYANATSSPDELVELSAINSIHPENIYSFLGTKVEPSSVSTAVWD